jgi:hypothetical protein
MGGHGMKRLLDLLDDTHPPSQALDVPDDVAEPEVLEASIEEVSASSCSCYYSGVGDSRALGNQRVYLGARAIYYCVPGGTRARGGFGGGWGA